ncbi:MAG: UPF0149 family protein [Oceanococcus sp.]
MDLNIYSDLAEWLMEVEATTGPAGFDGQLAGMWCRHSELPNDLALDEVDQQNPAWDALLNYAQNVKQRLEDSDCSYAPVLPPDTAPLRDRLTALADWSGGVLFGIGSAGQLDLKAVSDEVQELLKDLAEICKLNVNDEGSDIEDSYIEIVEYLKVAAQTLYVELHPQAG